MLNFRKLKQDFAAGIIKEGKELFDKGSVAVAKILHLDQGALRLHASVRGSFENVYECEIEIDRNASQAIDSNCDCTYTYDCQHIAALLFYLEQHLDQILVDYSQQTDLTQIDEKSQKELKKTFVEAATKEVQRRDVSFQKEILHEYVGAAQILGSSSFFLSPEALQEEKAELALIFNSSSGHCFENPRGVDIQLALRLPTRSKPLFIPHLKAFIDAVRYREPISISGRRYFFTLFSFEREGREILQKIIDYGRFSTHEDARLGQLDREALGTVLESAFDLALLDNAQHRMRSLEAKEPLTMPCLYSGNLEVSLYLSTTPAQVEFELERLHAPGPTLLMKPRLILAGEKISLEEGVLLESTKPGIIFKNCYYRFQSKIRRVHLRELSSLRDMTVPEPLFGTFIENGVPVLLHYANVVNLSLLDKMVTLPYAGPLKGRCAIHYLNGELDAELYFLYENREIPAAPSKLQFEDLTSFVSDAGILARDLVEEKKLIDGLFQDFLFDEKEGVFRLKSEKKIVEFMTEVVPKYQDRISFSCPENLSEQFIYDQTTFELHLSESDQIDNYQINFKVDGYLEGIGLDCLWECLSLRKRFIEIDPFKKESKKGRQSANKLSRILVLDLEKLAPMVQLFDDVGIKILKNQIEAKPLWSLTGISEEEWRASSVKFTMSKALKQIQKEILGEKPTAASEIPKVINATLRSYQIVGVHWLERLRRMRLGGILADDMGLGKTLQAIIALTQHKEGADPMPSLVVCPTSLVYNWKEEFGKFNPLLKVLVIDNVPQIRKKLLSSALEYDVVITSYNLLQKDIEIYSALEFDYVILDEAQHIKNRSTRNAKSVKRVKAGHKLILTGTPIENSLEELWSLFDFLMPGFLSSYDRFVEKYIRPYGLYSTQDNQHLLTLRKKVSPFILRRMKEDVLDDLPPVSEIIYHCHLSATQKALYHSYAASAKEELSRLVKKEGFDKIQIHVLATLTRLKQICCHPAIFAKPQAEEGDSAKYDMLMELLPTLIEGKHKTVIFSQYTKMLTILREDLSQKGIPFAYLDGSSKNRLEIVNKFNQDATIPIFLVSLKAGGAGLNLVGADTVIHYDIWWNPAVEDQATDRVHRIGQKKSVSSYKLVTLDTIEEKILTLQNRKRGFVKKVVSSDEEAISKLTWEEVLELLKTEAVEKMEMSDV